MRLKAGLESRPRRVAIIGSGLAGLTTAYLLRREGCEVWLIEKSDRLGFHSASVEIPLDSVHEDGPQAGPSKLASSSAAHGSATLGSGAARPRKWVVDVPMRSFQGGYYPLLIALYKHLGLRLRETFYTFSFSHLHASPPHPPEPSRSQMTQPRRRDVPYFIYSGASGLSLPALPSKYSGSYIATATGAIMFLGIAVCQILLLLLAFLGWHDLLPSHLTRDSTMRQFTQTVTRRLERPLPSLLPRLRTPLGSIWERFIADLIIPLFGSVGTMTVEDVWETRIGCLLDYVHCSVGTPHYTLEPGVGAAGVAKRLAREVARQGPGHLRLGETVIGFACPQAEDDGEARSANVIVKCLSGDIPVDQVVIATQPRAAVAILEFLDQAMLEGRNTAERRRLKRMMSALGEVDSRETIVATHRDYDVLPLEPDLREINLHLPVVGQMDRSEVPTPPLSPSSTSAASSRPQTPLDGSAISAPFFPPSPHSVYTMATHVIRPPSGLEQQRPVLQTTNPVMAIDPSKTLSVSRFERALPMWDPVHTFRDLHPACGEAIVHLAGSYAHPGIPLLEGCVGSAIRATQAVLSSESNGGSVPTTRSKARLGGVDWTTGQGGLVGRIWRWRREPAEYKRLR